MNNKITVGEVIESYKRHIQDDDLPFKMSISDYIRIYFNGALIEGFDCEEITNLYYQTI